MFFSWQSDIPPGCNKLLIEDAVQLVIDERKTEQWQLQERIDEATVDAQGAVDIVGSLMKKIDLCSVFIADITLINPGVDVKRRTPNPNVLFELGYAANAVGWENIILIFNEAYGELKDVPFDIQGQRIFKYKLLSGSEKNGERAGLAKKLKRALAIMLENQPNADTIKTAIKLEVDYQIMEFGNHIYKLLFDPPVLIMPGDILDMMALNGRQMITAIEKRKPFGFQVLKSWEEYISALKSVKNNSSYSKYLSIEKLVYLIKVIEELEIASRNFITSRFYKPIGMLKNQKKYRLQKGRNGIYRLFHYADGEWHVSDEGIFYDGDEKDMLKVFQVLPDEAPILALCLSKVFEATNALIDAWGGMIIANPALTRF